ncbi:hypothetical protein N656DRAFT_636117 [Canariomyces notabilis]|uniref:Uncharacterized protein n=1 Tax=Canariomyces notabilis TaxID=2074819 RepID=A0AAN6TEI3_9PEZI|nr:hypothetical protein N656DRAFT_636117 [Canariomyces arenarius]
MATWYGRIKTNPGIVKPHTSNTQAGEFASRENTATGTTGVTVYTGLDPNKVLILLIMMPYGTGTTNKTKVAFYDKSNTTVNQDLVEHVWNKRCCRRECRVVVVRGRKDPFCLCCIQDWPGEQRHGHFHSHIEEVDAPGAGASRKNNSR